MPPRERELPYNKGNAFKNFFAVLCWPKPITYCLPMIGVDVRYVQPRAYFELEDHRFDKLPMVGEGQWDDPINFARETAPETNVPMTQIVRN